MSGHNNFILIRPILFLYYEESPELSLAGVLGVLQHPQNLGVQLTLFQPEGADYAHQITDSTLDFENLTTALKSDIIKFEFKPTQVSLCSSYHTSLLWYKFGTVFLNLLLVNPSSSEHTQWSKKHFYIQKQSVSRFLLTLSHHFNVILVMNYAKIAIVLR